MHGESISGAPTSALPVTSGGRPSSATRRACRSGSRPRLPLMLVVCALVSAAVGLGPSAVPPASAFALTANWIQLAPSTSPPSRTAAAMTYDTATASTVLFGGEEVTDGSGAMLSDTWTLAGSTWTQQFPTSSPPPRY